MSIVDNNGFHFTILCMLIMQCSSISLVRVESMWCNHFFTHHVLRITSFCLEIILYKFGGSYSIRVSSCVVDFTQVSSILMTTRC